MVDICLPSPSWSKGSSSRHSTHSSKHQPEQKPHYSHGQIQEQVPSTPASSNSQSSSRYQVDSLGSGTSSKSCFSIFGKHNNHHPKNRLSSHFSSRSRVSSDESSSHQPLRGMAAVSSSQMAASSSDFAKTWEAFSANQFPSQVGDSWNQSLTSEDGEGIGNFALLQPPKPKDRSHKQRLKQEQERRKSGVYEGELEPEGTRGEEAKVTVVGGSAQTTTPMRTFKGNDRSSPAAALALAPNQQHAESPVPRRSSSIPLETIAEMSESRASDSRSASHSPQRHMVPQSPTRSVDPPGNTSFDEKSNSTSSSEDISRMMSDFLHPPKDSLNSSLLEREYPNPIRMPRSDWQAPSSPATKQHPPQQQSPPTRSPRPPHYGTQSNRPVPVSESSGSSTGSPYRMNKVNRISPDPSAASSGHRVLPISPNPAESNKQANRTIPISPDPSPAHHPLRQPSTNGFGVLPPPQNQHSPQRSHGSSSHLSTRSKSSQPDPEGRLSPQKHKQQPHSNSIQQQQPHSNSVNTPPPQSIDAWNAQALQHVHNGEYDMALAAFQHVLRAYKQQYGHVHPLVASAYHNLGTVHAKRAQLLLEDTLHQRHCRAQSLQCFQSAARAARDSLGRDHPNVAVSLVRIGFLLLQARQYNNAVITFQEALRIRQTHYGPHHALVANLYNNLGVCYMHLAQFAHGRDLLEHALTIQRTLLEEAEAAQGSNSNSQALELADTLFNIGGLALEWIRRQGPDVRHAQDAEAAFEEALELRKSVLGPKDPMVLQVKSLLDMARSIPRPRSPGGGKRSNGNKTKGNGNVNFQPDTPNQRPPDPLGISPPDTTASARKGDSDPNISPLRVNHRDTSPKFQQQHPAKPGSPYRYYGTSPSRSHDSHSPSRAPKHPQQEQQSPRSATLQYNTAKVDYLEPPRVTRRSLLDHQHDNGGGPPEKPRHALSPTGASSEAGRVSIASSAASTVKTSSPGRLQKEGPKYPAAFLPGDRSVFRQESLNQKKKEEEKKPPPMMEIAVSQDEDDDGLYDPAALQRPAQTNIFISPHYVPHMSPHKVNNMDDTPRSTPGSTYSGVPVSTATSSSGGGAITKTYSYDPEEQLVLTDGNTDDNNPLPDDYDAMPLSSQDSGTGSTRKIMVVRPYRSMPDDSITSPTSVLSARTPWDNSMLDDAKEATANSSSLHSSELEYSSKTASYGRDAPRDSNDNARSETLSRARALLQAHNPNPDYLDSPQVQLSGKPSYLKNHSPDRAVVKQQLFKPGQESSFDEDLEDGLAPLGASEAFPPSSSGNTFHPDMLTNKPDEHMREIYEEASRCLKNHNYMEAQEYFTVILQCQRHLHGPFHQDVAASLHNCGLAQLRAGNHHEALKSFEEAVRIRKGTLGKEHPHVAASLVKCGITFLLLHRFEEALWSFREALSIRKHSLGTLHPSTARIYNNIGCVHMEFNELREARRAFEGALDIQRNALCHDPESGPVRFGAAATLCNMGYLYRYRGMHERAAQVLREAADIQEDILGGTHPTVLSTLDSLAEALGNSGQAAEALKTQETILERFEATETPGSRRLIRAEAGLKYKMSKSAKQMNDREKQIKNLQQALQAVRELDEQTEAARNQASALEKRILSDLREVRNSEETHELNWV